MTIYIIDTSVFIEAARRYYAFDIAPTFWYSLAYHHRIGTIQSIDRVKYEIDRGRDFLVFWISIYFSFESTNNANVVSEYARIMQWAANHPQYDPSAKSDFARADNADAWLVAYAMAQSCTVVTEEKSAPQARRAIKMPDVCNAHNVQYIDTFTLMRRLKIVL